jgi:thioredoxin-related protein
MKITRYRKTNEMRNKTTQNNSSLLFMFKLRQVLMLGLFGLYCGLGLAATESSLPASLVNPGYHAQPDWFSQTFLELNEDIAEAAAEKKQLMLYFYQDGCPYCAKLLRDNFAQPDIAKKIQAHFKVIALNIWGDREVTDFNQQITTEKAFARDQNVQYTPTLLMLTQTGQLALRLNGYLPPDKMHQALDYAIARQTGEKTPQSKLDSNANTTPLPPLAAALTHPLRLADNRQQSYRPLMVIFSEHDCSACRKLQHLLQQPQIATALTNLDIAQLNRWSTQAVQTPQGKMFSTTAWADQQQIHFSPSLVFFDTQGEEIFRVDTLLESFHLKAVLDYVISGAYRHQPSFQRFIQHRAETLEARGIAVELLDPIPENQ